MSLKRTFPYFLTSAAMLFGTGNMSFGTNENNEDGPNSSNSKIVSETVISKTPDTAHTYVAKAEMILPAIAINAVAHRYDVVYTRADGNQFRRSGGTRAWRNNNPGCLRYSEFTAANGAIGTAGGFAVFPDEQTGMRAICALLKSDGYRNLTISQAIFKYAPPHENNTENYKATLRRLTGLQITTKLRDLTDEQISRVAAAIKIIEGWRIGKETQIQTNVLSQQVPVQDSLNRYTAVKNDILYKSFEHTI